jgi:hypothetical protein
LDRSCHFKHASLNPILPLLNKHGYR